MKNRLFVGNISFRATEEGLGDLFREVGTVNSVKILTDRDTGRSKGFGFVEMETDELAAQAIEKLDGQEWEGRPLKVNVARPREERPRGGNRNFERNHAF